MGTNKKTAPCGNTERKATGYDAFFKALEGMKIYEAQLLLDACKGAFDVMEIQFHLAGRD